MANLTTYTNTIITVIKTMSCLHVIYVKLTKLHSVEINLLMHIEC